MVGPSCNQAQMPITPFNSILRASQHHQDTSNRILGVYLNPMGDFTEQLQMLQRKSDAMANCAKASRISATNMHISLRTVYEPSMFYALVPAIATDEENMSAVQTRMIATALQNSGLPKTLPWLSDTAHMNSAA